MASGLAKRHGTSTDVHGFTPIPALPNTATTAFATWSCVKVFGTAIATLPGVIEPSLSNSNVTLSYRH